jgi:hypothetical protein
MLRSRLSLRLSRTLVGTSVPRVGVAPVTFGRTKREAIAAENEAKDRAEEAREARRKETSQAVEDAAWQQVSRDYGFVLKPAFHSWRTFLDELQRYELVWEHLASPSASGLRLRAQMFDHLPIKPDLGSVSATLFDLVFSEKKADSLSDLLSATVDMHRTTRPIHGVVFQDEDPHVPPQALEMEVYLHADCNVQVPIERTWLLKRGDVHKVVPGMSGESQAAPGPLSTSTAVGKPADQSPWLCVRGRLTDMGGNASPQLFDMSLAGFTSVTLRSLTTFLNSKIGGVPTFAYIAPANLKGDVDTMWTTLRASAKMHPQTLPVDYRLLSQVHSRP